jgi:hypothetical protein
MNGTKGFRIREAAANRRNRNHRIVAADVRNARFANLHGNAVDAEPVSPPAEVTDETKVDQTEVQTDAETEIVDGEGADDQSEGDETDDESEGDEDEGDAEADEAGADASKTGAKKPARKKGKRK